MARSCHVRGGDYQTRPVVWSDKNVRKTVVYQPPAFLSLDTFQDQAIDKAWTGMGAFGGCGMGVGGEGPQHLRTRQVHAPLHGGQQGQMVAVVTY